ncbi:DUF2147 domain-containing protein [Bradyrhizobium betae]|uniref:DUF2147 domain-containing protein n=1 Tax=Bradyrhizobium betae TaxID=244734 RepID=A0A5P6PB00_9BRAD|nr:DUF2147 domain-containing protein [Bradyrhizobium betae]
MYNCTVSTSRYSTRLIARSRPSPGLVQHICSTVDGEFFKMKWIPWLSAILFAITTAPAQSASATGEWLVADKSARIAIHACGHRLRGTIAWERVHGLDDQNPDLSKRHRTTLGLPILIGMQSTGLDTWAGRIYNADNGKTYAAKVKLLSPTSLFVEGCVMGILCGGETWTKVREHAEDCPASPPTPPAPKQ